MSGYYLHMALSRDARRRWLGGICLAIAGGMLILGQTVLKGQLQQQAFIYYWLICAVFTGLTLIIALLDLRAVRLRAQREQKELVSSVLREITRKQDEKSGAAERK